MKTRLLLHLILWLIVITFQPPAALAQDFADVCQQPENILPNCNFDNGRDHWQFIVEDGQARFDVLQGGGECHAPLCPAAYIVTEDHFVGSLYQQVPVVAGNTYYANVVWLVFDSLTNDAAVYNVGGGIGRRIGLDPFGGTNPASENVVWGPDVWRNDCKICNVEEVTATAQTDTMTVFLRIDDTWRARVAEQGYPVPPSKDQFWIDDIGLKQVAGDLAPSSLPTDLPSSPTDTPIPPPPTDTPLPELPTNTPAPPTETPAEMAQAGSPEPQSISPLQTPTPARTIAPPPTLTPSSTPPPTDTPEPSSSTPTPRQRPAPPPSEPPVLSAGLLGAVGTTICAGGLILVAVAALLAGLTWLYRLGWGKPEEDDEFDDDFDDDEEIIVEITE